VSVHREVSAARDRLRQAGIDTVEAELDARLLAQHVLGWDTARYFSSADEPASATFLQPYARCVARRAAREPLAYIVGHREFWGLTFEVTPAVLVPRPETELLVEASLDTYPDRSAPLDIADVCTGSGCLAVALASSYPNARIVAIDVSADALTVARRNLARHGVAERVALLQDDLFSRGGRHFDLIVANPPYVPEPERGSVQPEVRDFEPAIALFAGSDGMSVISRLVPSAIERLVHGGTLAFEFGMGQGEAVRDLISRAPGLRMSSVNEDLRGIPRVALAQRVSRTV